jgi:DNA-binding transcriptional regulator PaaX
MENLEIEIKKEIRATKIQKVVLQTIATAGILSVALLAPNALQALKIFGINKKSKINRERSINISRERLIKKGLVEYSKNGMLSLTITGQKQLAKIERMEFKVKIPKKWDGKWRVLIFDIQERKRLTRDKIRVTLNYIGFIKLQNSVWVYPYDCEDLITLLKADFGIGREVLYMIVDKIENDKTLRSHFKL